MKRFLRVLALSTLLVALLAPFAVSTASAHGHTTVGDYELVIGFHNEPAYQGEPNGLDLFVTNAKTKEKVNDLADTLKAEIIFGSSKKQLTIKPQWGQDGAYTAYVLPNQAGDYTWHIYGDIKGTPIDVSMTSSPETFGSVEAKSEVAFPAAEPTTVDLQAQLATAESSARTALLVGLIGTALGVVGVVAGVLGMRTRRSLPVSQSQQQRTT